MSTLLTLENVTYADGIWTNKAIAANAAISVTKLEQKNLQEYAINLFDCRVWDAVTTILPSAAANDDLGLIGGTFGTNSPSMQTGDLASAGATTRYARFLAILPPEYVAGETVQLRARVDMSAVADSAATIDFSAYRSDENAGIGSDLVSTDATSCNSTTDADYDFTVTASSLFPGDVLDVRVAFAITDSATPSGVTGTIGKLSLLCDTQG